MKNRRSFQIILGILILLFVALSFAPCLKMSNTYIHIEGDNSVESYFLKYSPAFCCIVSFFELLLLFLSERSLSKIVRTVLDLVKTAVPGPLTVLANKMAVDLNPDVYMMRPEPMYPSLTYTPFGYLILGVGVLIGILDLLDIFFRTEEDE